MATSTIKASDNVYELGQNTVENLQSVMVSYAANLPDNATKNIVFSVSTSSAPFYATRYTGTLTRIAATRLVVNVYQAMNSAIPIFGRYRDGIWEWNSGAVNPKDVCQEWGTVATATRTKGHFLVLINGNFMISGWFASSTQIHILGIHGVSGSVYHKQGENTLTCGQNESSTEVTLTRSGNTLTVTTTSTATITIFTI